MKKLTVKLFIAIFALLLCWMTSMSQQPNRNVGVANGWKQVNANGLFTFHLPQGAWDTGFSGTEDFYKEYRIGKLRFMFVYHPTSRLSYDAREQEFGKGFREQIIEIDGRKAYLFDYVQNEKGRKRYYTDLYIGDFPHNEVKLWMQADSWRAADLETAKKIFETVRFLQP
jgi:hypothetical protein